MDEQEQPSLIDAVAQYRWKVALEEDARRRMEQAKGTFDVCVRRLEEAEYARVEQEQALREAAIRDAKLIKQTKLTAQKRRMELAEHDPHS